MAEVEGLVDAGYGREDPGMTGAGYREIVDFLDGVLTLEEATERIRSSHRKYARRQGTWFRHQLGAGCKTLDGTLEVGEAAGRIAAWWEESGEGA